MFYSSACSVYRHQSVYTEAEGKVHFSGCFLKGFCFLVLSNWLPRGARENLDFEFESSWFCAERLESLPLEASATTGVRSWPWSPKVVVFFYFFLVFLWLHIKGKDELDLTVKTDRDEKGRHHLAGGVEGGRPSSIPPPQKHTWGWAASQSYLSHLPQHQRPPTPGAAPTATWAVHAAVSSSPKVCGWHPFGSLTTTCAGAVEWQHGGHEGQAKSLMNQVRPSVNRPKKYWHVEFV